MSTPRAPWFSLYQLWQQYWADTQSHGLKQADRWLSLYFKTHKNHGKRDRRFLTEWFFAGLRYALLAVFCEDVFTKTISIEHYESWLQSYATPPALVQRIQALPGQRLFSWIRLRCQTLEHITTELIVCYQQCEHYLKSTNTLSALLLLHSIPGGYLPFLEQRSLVWSSAFLAQQDQKPPLWLRLRPEISANAITAELAAHELSVITEQHLTHHIALAVSGETGIYNLPSYQTGNLEIQDLASQYIGDAIQLSQPKAFILDACAGGGGKTMQIAALLNHQGAVYASDIREYKLDEIKRRAKKAQFGNVRTFAWDWSQEAMPAFPREVQNRQGFDWVLVDAPCSASGTWRRNPDAKWRFDLSTLPSLTQLQLTLLCHAARAVKPQGMVVYSTCSFLPAENEQLIERFLAMNPHFQRVSAQLLGAPQQNSDTMFVAVLQYSALLADRL